LARSINELLPNVVCKLKDSDKFANAEAKAHRDAQYRRKYAEEKYVERRVEKKKGLALWFHRTSSILSLYRADFGARQT
jgi:hypothetical protein